MEESKRGGIVFSESGGEQLLLTSVLIRIWIQTDEFHKCDPCLYYIVHKDFKYCETNNIKNSSWLSAFLAFICVCLSSPSTPQQFPSPSLTSHMCAVYVCVYKWAYLLILFLLIFRAFERVRICSARQISRWCCRSFSLYRERTSASESKQEKITGDRV